jgi:hypothetical protein
VAGPYRPYDDDVAVIYWLIVGESGVDKCHVPGECCEDTWPNPEAPRVTHFFGSYGCVKLIWESTGFDPGTSPTA